MTRLATAVIVLITLAWVTVTVFVWRAQQPDPSASTVRQLFSLTPSPPRIEGYLTHGFSQRPLYAPAWMALAERLHSDGQSDAASRAAALAQTLWPEHEGVLWQNALLQLELGDGVAATDHLLHYWVLQPGEGLLVLAIIRQLYPDPQDLVAAAATVWEDRHHPALTYQRRVVDLARRTGDVALATALWERLSPTDRTQPQLLFPLLDMLLAEQAYTAAANVWQTAMDSDPGLYNGSFEQPLLNAGLGWRYRSGEGYRIRRVDSPVYAGQHSLLIEFAGTHNVDLRWPAQTVLVTPGQRYRLSGYWSAYEITTRSGVGLEIQTQGGQRNVRAALEPRWGSWSWQPFHLDIEVPDDVQRVLIRVRRSATQALDQRIAGKLWLDALQLHPLSPDD